MPAGGLLIAVLDTSVLMRAGLVEFLVSVHGAGACLVRWSQAIAMELNDVLPRRPEVADRIAAALAQVPDSILAVTEADDSAATGGCDDGDRHVLAAAICAKRMFGDAGISLVTGNLSDFDQAAAADRGIYVVGPDGFGLYLLECRPLPVLRTVQRQPEDRYRRYLDRMRADGMTETADEIDRLFREL